MLTEEQQEDLFNDVWRRVVTIISLSVLLYDDISSDLQKALFQGYGGGLNDFANNPSKRVLLDNLNRNLFRFSAAKEFQQINDMSNFILDEFGNIRPFSDFRIDAKKIFDKYNDTWLEAEFDTVVAQSQSASQWIDIQAEKGTLPLLKYQTAGDSKVRPEHAAWDNIVRPVDDSFWNTHMPPNGFNCRCIVIQTVPEDDSVSSLSGVDTIDGDDVFALNFGKDQFLFRTNGQGPHPYFEVPGRLEGLKRNNFGLPLP